MNSLDQMYANQMPWVSRWAPPQTDTLTDPSLGYRAPTNNVPQTTAPSYGGLLMQQQETPAAAAAPIAVPAPVQPSPITPNPAAAPARPANSDGVRYATAQNFPQPILDAHNNKLRAMGYAPLTMDQFIARYRPGETLSYNQNMTAAPSQAAVRYGQMMSRLPISVRQRMADEQGLSLLTPTTNGV